MHSSTGMTYGVTGGTQPLPLGAYFGRSASNMRMWGTYQRLNLRPRGNQIPGIQALAARQMSFGRNVRRAYGTGILAAGG